MSERKTARRRPSKDVQEPQPGQGTGTHTHGEPPAGGPVNVPTGPVANPVGQAAAPTKHVGRPTGKIPTNLKVAFGRGGDWALVTQDAALHEKYGNPYDIAAMLMAMEVIESGGKMIWNQGGSGAYGIMQIKESDWGWLAKELGVSLQTREGQIATAAEIVGKRGRGTNPRDRFLQSYYPVRDEHGNICLDCTGEDGGTPRQYLEDMDRLIKIIDKAAEPIEPVPVPEPQGDVIDLLYGGKNYVISASYGQKITWSCPGCYEYQRAYGLDTAHHYAYDVSGGEGAPLYAPFSGTIVCAGTDRGSGAWRTGCAAFPRYNNYGSRRPNGNGSGRIELLNDEGTASLIIGHALSCTVSAGTHVAAGDLIGYEGGMNGPHVHLEARYDGGSKIGDPRKLFKGGPVPAERVPYDFENDPNLFSVKAIKNVKVYQRGDPKSPVIDMIPAGDTFQAVAIVPGNDKKMWWLGVRNGRVPFADTECVSCPS